MATTAKRRGTVFMWFYVFSRRNSLHCWLLHMHIAQTSCSKMWFFLKTAAAPALITSSHLFLEIQIQFYNSYIHLSDVELGREQMLWQFLDLISWVRAGVAYHWKIVSRADSQNLNEWMIEMMNIDGIELCKSTNDARNIHNNHLS